MTEQRMFRLAVEAITVSAHRDVMGRWTFVISARRGDEGWDEAYTATHTLLSTDEFLYVLDAELASRFGE